MPARAQPLPDRIEAPGGLLLRRWETEDAEALERAVTASLDHLRPWMPWAAEEPLTLERRRELIGEWDTAWRDGDDLILGTFRDGVVVGGCGLHRRVGPGGLEIGYWVHAAHVRQGIATAAAAALTTAAFTVPEIDYVEIHHDRANAASGGVPRRIGYRLVVEQPDEPEAPGETGISCIWRVERGNWPPARRP